MDSPPYMCRHRPIKFSVCRLCFPNKFCLTFLQDVFIRSFNKESLDPDMGKNGQCRLRMTERISRNCYFREIVELFFQEMQSKLKVLYYIVIIATALVMFHVSSTHDLPIFGLQKFLYLFTLLKGLLEIPSLEESHFAVEKCSMGFHSFIAFGLAEYFTIPKSIFCTLEYLLYRVESVASKI